MWTVGVPPFNALDTFKKCISGIKCNSLLERLQQIENIIESSAEDYDNNASQGNLHLVNRTNTVGDCVTREEMSNVYNQYFVRKGGPAREIYDKIKLLPKGGRCPYCDQRTVITLDHFLPKSHYPVLAVVPLNLVGCCSECNKKKGALYPKAAEDCLLHPYVDNIDDQVWLVAEVVHCRPCAIKFTVSCPSGWDTVQQCRVNKQFNLFDLGQLYSIEAARELSNIKYNLKMHYDAGGKEAVRVELNRQWESRARNQKNAWQTAMYSAASCDDWFCDGGFL